MLCVQNFYKKNAYKFLNAKSKNRVIPLLFELTKIGTGIKIERNWNAYDGAFS